MAGRFVTSVLFALALAPAAMAGPFEDGLAAYSAGDYPGAIAIWTPLAEEGDAFAQLWVGVMNRNGRGTERDLDEALRLWRLSAAQTASWAHVLAQYWLGLAYANAEGVPRDLVAAHMWFDLAAEGGNASAAADLMAAETLMTPGEIAEAQRLAEDWRLSHPR